MFGGFISLGVIALISLYAYFMIRIMLGALYSHVINAAILDPTYVFIYREKILRKA